MQINHKMRRYMHHGKIGRIHTLEEFDYLESELRFETSNDIDECERSIENGLGLTVKLTLGDIQKRTERFRLIEESFSYMIYQAY
jgi:hypothetical protein